MSKIEDELSVLISEMQAYEKSLHFAMAGYEQEVMGEKHFACKICGHCPAALIERLKLLLPSAPKTSK